MWLYFRVFGRSVAIGPLVAVLAFIGSLTIMEAIGANTQTPLAFVLASLIAGMFLAQTVISHYRSQK
jgi:hypothetical protein